MRKYPEFIREEDEEGEEENVGGVGGEGGEAVWNEKDAGGEKSEGVGQGTWHSFFL